MPELRENVIGTPYIQKQGICFNCFHIAQWDDPSEFPINGNSVIVCPNCGGYIECNPWKGSIVSAESKDGTPSETVVDLGKGSISLLDPITKEISVTLTDPSQIYTVLAAERRYIPEEQEQNPETNPVIHKFPDPALTTDASEMIQNDFMEAHGINMPILAHVDSDEDDEDETDPGK